MEVVKDFMVTDDSLTEREQPVMKLARTTPMPCWIPASPEGKTPSTSTKQQFSLVLPGSQPPVPPVWLPSSASLGPYLGVISTCTHRPNIICSTAKARSKDGALKTKEALSISGYVGEAGLGHRKSKIITPKHSSSQRTPCKVHECIHLSLI